jgi:hypothetical protein
VLERLCDVKFFKISFAVVVAIALLGRSAMGDAIKYDAQFRAIAVDASVTGYTRAGTSMTPKTVDQSSGVASPGFGPFSAGQSATAQLGAASPMTASMATQESDLGATGFTAGGMIQAGSVLAGNGSGSASASATFHVTFDVATALGYVLTANLADKGVAGSPRVNLSFTNEADDALFASVSSAGSGNFTFSGTLLPGTYAVALDAKASSSSGELDAEAYALTFQTGDMAVIASGTALTPADVPVISVPAPAAVLSAGVTMAGIIAATYVRRRWARWVLAALA